jgi:flavin reductase (DIM6/NTAB) family NADH-FMN oxidoreductase RutF
MITPDVFRAVMRNLVSGVTVVTTRFEGEQFGMTATSFTSVSVDPILVQVSLQKGSRTHEAVGRSGKLAVSILAAGQQRVAAAFAVPGSSGFQVCDVEEGPAGLPLIAGAIGHLESRVVDQFEGGDHTMFIGEVLSGHAGQGPPLIHFQGRYLSMEEGMPSSDPATLS